MASSSTATISSSFSSLRSSFLVKTTTDRSFCSDNTYNPKQLRCGGTGTGTGNGRLNPHLRLKSRPSSPSSLRVVCLREFRTAKVTQQSWEELVLRSEAPVLVEFYASWCGPCQMVHRVVNEIAVEYRGKVHCLMLNTDSDSEVAEDYDIKAVPVVLIFKNGEKRESIIGTMPKEFYVAAIEKALET